MVDTVEEKNAYLSFVAKATLPHGNAAPDRGFSVNTAFVTKDRGSLSERSIIALRVVNEAIRL